MSAPLTQDLAGPQPQVRRRPTYLIGCFAVGCFAGALASFFPRLMAIIAGNPTEQLTVFSPAYIAVGCVVSLIVGVVILITDTDEEKRLRDVFFSALGIPTLLMGSISSTATSSSVAELQRDRQSVVESLQLAEKIQTGDSNASIPIDIGGDAAPAPLPGPDSVPPPGANPGKTSWQLQDLLGAPAYAQTPPGRIPTGSPLDGGLGITARQSDYVVVYGRAADSKDLDSLKADLQRRGIRSVVQRGTRGDYVLVPREGVVRPYSDAVRAAIGAKAAGANPYVVRVPSP